MSQGMRGNIFPTAISGGRLERFLDGLDGLVLSVQNVAKLSAIAFLIIQKALKATMNRYDRSFLFGLAFFVVEVYPAIGNLGPAKAQDLLASCPGIKCDKDEQRQVVPRIALASGGAKEFCCL